MMALFFKTMSYPDTNAVKTASSVQTFSGYRFSALSIQDDSCQTYEAIVFIHLLLPWWLMSHRKFGIMRYIAAAGKKWKFQCIII